MRVLKNLGWAVLFTVVAWLGSRVPYLRWFLWLMAAGAWMNAFGWFEPDYEKEERTARARQIAADVEEENRTVREAMEISGDHSPENEAALRRHYRSENAAEQRWQ